MEGAPAPVETADATFTGLLEASWQRHAAMVWNAQSDDVLLGGIIASAVASGWSLIDLSSDSAQHLARFDHQEHGTRLLVEIESITEELELARVLGRLARTTIGFGRRVNDVDTVMSAMKSDLKSGFMSHDEPGAVTIDGHVGSGFVYAQVALLLDLNDYLCPDRTINYPMLQSHLGATTASLDRYLSALLEPSNSNEG